VATTLYLKQQTNSFFPLTSLFLLENGTDFFELEDGSGQIALENSYQYASSLRSVLPFVTAVTNTVASGTNIQMTQVAGGVLLSFISPPLAFAVTIAGNITFNLYALESNAAANATVAVSVSKYTGNDELAPFLTSSFGTELGTSVGLCNWTGSPTSTALAAGDRIVFCVLITNATAQTMGGGFTVTLDYAGLTAAANGDAFITFTETIAWQLEAELIQVAPLVVATSITMPGTTAAGNVIVLWAETGNAVSLTAGSWDGTNSYVAGPASGSLDNLTRGYAQNVAAGGPYTITPTFSGAAGGTFLLAAEYGGLAASAFDVSGAAQSGTSTAMASGSASTNFPNEIIVGLFDSGGSAVNSGFNTLRTGKLIMDRSVSATGSYNSAATIAPSAFWDIGMMAFQWGTQNQTANRGCERICRYQDSGCHE